MDALTRRKGPDGGCWIRGGNDYASECPKNNDGNTPLHFAAMDGHFGIYQLILKESKDKSPINNIGKTPQDYCNEFMSNFKP